MTESLHNLASERIRVGGGMFKKMRFLRYCQEDMPELRFLVAANRLLMLSQNCLVFQMIRLLEFKTMDSGLIHLTIVKN